MPIAMTCPSCAASFRLADDLAGKKGKCPKCQHVFVIPTNETAVTATPPEPRRPTVRRSAESDVEARKSGLGVGMIVLIVLLGGVAVLGCGGCLVIATLPVFLVAEHGPVPVAEPVAVNVQGKDPVLPAKKVVENKDRPPFDDKKADDIKQPPIDKKKVIPPPADGKKDDGKQKVVPPPIDPELKPPTYVPIGSYLQSIFPAKKGRFVGDLLWARDGQSFYALTDAGLVRQFKRETGEVLQEFDFDQKCGNLALSGEGLLVAMLDANEVWVVDPLKLEDFKKKIPVPALIRVTAGRDAKIAVASSLGKGGRAGLNLVDLERGVVTKPYPEFDIRNATASPDGKYVFAQGGIEQLLRFRLGPEEIVEEEKSERIVRTGKGVCISPDSRYVCVPSAEGNGQGHPDHPPAAPFSTYIYPVTNLKRPLCVLNSGQAPQAVGFDATAGAILTQNNVKPMMIFMYTGNKRAEFEIKNIKGSDVREFAMSPLGFELVLRTDENIVHVKLNKK